MSHYKRSGWTKFKGLVKEFFSRDAKTRDVAFDQAVKDIKELVNSVVEQQQVIVNFIVISTGKSHVLTNFVIEMLDKSEALGNILKIFYEDSPYARVMSEVQEKLRFVTDMKDKNQRIGIQLRNAKDNILNDLKTVTELCKKREEDRIYYDHYRRKLESLIKSTRESQNDYGPKASKENEKLERNKEKFALRKREYDD